MSAEPPFKFLDPYGRDDYGRFFGRERETAQLYNAVYAANLTLLYGPSGVGKTSLVQCGLAGKFHESDWFPLFIRRGSSILRALEEALCGVIQEPGADCAGLPLPEKVRLLYLEQFKPIYLIFDQFEELFIHGDKDEQRAFYLTIRELLSAGLQARVLISIREEWMAYLNEFELYLPNLLNNRVRLERMNDANVLRVLLGTLRTAGIGLEEPQRRVLEAILNNIRDRRDGVELTDLQIYLDRLYRAFRADHSENAEVVFGRELIEAVGPMKNAISDFLDEQIALLEQRLERERGIANPRGIPLEVLFTLVTDEKTKQARAVADIWEALPRNRNLRPEDVQFCLDEFARIQLLNYFE